MRRALLIALRLTGAFRLWRWWHRDAVIILTVHGVMDRAAADVSWQPLRPRVSAAWLDASLAVLKTCYTFVSLDEAADMLAGRRDLVPNAIVLTFDDGYRNQVSQVEPVVRRHGVPATVFVATGPVVSRAPFWFDRLDYALQHIGPGRREVTIGSRPVTIDGSNRVRLAESYAALRVAAKAPVRDDRAMNRELDDLAAALERESGRRLSTIFESDPWSVVLTAPEIQAAREAVSFASHAVDHLRVNRLDRDTAAAQLSRSKADLEAWTGRRCRTFCYPDGGVSPEAARLARECGYDAAVTAERGLNHAGEDPMWLRRVDLPATGSATELLADVSGLKDWLLAVRGRVMRGASTHGVDGGGEGAEAGRSKAPAS